MPNCRSTRLASMPIAQAAAINCSRISSRLAKQEIRLGIKKKRFTGPRQAAEFLLKRLETVANDPHQGTSGADALLLTRDQSV